MSMQSYGSCQLLANMAKITEMYNFKELYDKINKLIEDEDILYLDDEDECSEELIKASKDFIFQVEIKLGIEIYPKYISSEAEGTDYAGELIWCIEPVLVDKVKEFADTWTTWSEFG